MPPIWTINRCDLLRFSATAIAPCAHRLKSHANMCLAIGFSSLRGQPTKPKIISCRITNGPLARSLSQFQQRQSLGLFFHFADLSQRLRANFIGRRLWRQGLPAGIIALRIGIGAAGSGAAGFATVSGFGGASGLCSAAGFASALDAVAGFADAVVARFESPKRCTFPITALRVTPPSSLAIWLADWPSPHIFFSSSTRSSVQDISFPYIKSGHA